MADGSSASGLQDDELYLPRTVVNKLIKEIVPNIRVTNDARDLLLNCCTEFIHLIASEASDISENQQKKVISPEHVVEALNTLGFQEYVADVEAVHKEYKEQASKHRKRGKSKLDRLGIPEEELLRQQQQLFEEARQQQMESELLEHQRAQQQLLQQQASQLQQPPSQGLPPQPPQQPPSQGLPPQPPQAPTVLPTQLTTPPSLQQQHPPHLQSQATASSSSVVDASLLGMSQPTVAPQAVPTAVRTTVTGLPTTAATMATGIGGGAASGLSSGGLAAALARGGVSEDTLTKAGMGVHQAQSINTAGLSMLAAVGARQQQEQQLIQQVTTQQSTPAKGPPQLLPNNAAITVASLQATSSLLQQALAMASAQVAASNTAQQQRPPATSAASTAGVGGATGASLPLPQSLLLQQQALAALAAHQVQMGSHLSQQLGQTGKGPFVVPTTSTPPPSTNTGMTPPTSVPVAFGTGANLQGSDNPGGPSPGGGLESGQLDSKVSPPT